MTVDTTAQLRPNLEWAVAPNGPNELPGARRFFALSGYENPGAIGISGAAIDFKSILKKVIDLSRHPKDLVQVLSVTTDDNVLDQVEILYPEDALRHLSHNSSTNDLLDRISIRDVLPEDSASVDLSLSQVTGNFGNQQDAAEVIRVLLEEYKERLPSLQEGIAIELESAMHPQRAARLARALGIDADRLKDQSLVQILDYLSGLSKRVDELTDLASAEGSLMTHRVKLGETAMLDEVEQQVGAECVLFATLNLANAAENSGAMVESVRIDEMQTAIPRGEGTNYRQFGDAWLQFMKSKGYEVHSDFAWGEAFKLISQGEAGLVLRVLQDHAVAVVGIRHAPDGSGKVQFLVANSLPDYYPVVEPGKTVWVNASELITKTVLLQPGEDGRVDNFLLTWNRVQ